MISAQGLRAVTFDVGGTLITPWPSVGRIYADVAARHGWPGLSADLLDQRFAAAWKGLGRFGHTPAEWARLVDATFEGLVQVPPSQTFFPVLYERFTQPEVWHVFEDVVPALKKLKGLSLSLGVVSNWDERLRPLLRSLDLEKFFDVIVVSCEVGCSKPARPIFEAAARELNLPMTAILHVGDSPEMDVAGAQACGMRAAWLQRRAPAAGEGFIRSLAEL